MCLYIIWFYFRFDTYSTCTLQYTRNTIFRKRVYKPSRYVIDNVPEKLAAVGWLLDYFVLTTVDKSLLYTYTYICM